MNNNQTKRITLFAHFDPHGIVDDYVLYYLARIREHSDFLMFISTSSLSGTEKSKADRYCDQVLIRDNVGYDFYSWRTGLEQAPDLSRFDELILCNDSVYGPIFPLSEMFDASRRMPSDVWGVTDCTAMGYHVQSYFMVFNREVFLSDAFRSFMRTIGMENRKEDVISKYEVMLTQTMLDNGYAARAYVPEINNLRKLVLKRFEQVRHRSFKRLFRDVTRKKMFARKRWQPDYLNRSHLYWKDLVLRFRMPFIKVELFRDNPATVDIKNYQEFLQKHTAYDPALIENHLSRIKAGGCFNG